ncbi:NAD(P)H-dependent glycerol-3-phosphate dehydrogenase [Neptuniibacter caesariensis]|uniref:Glycerol-3-phosphate dehydrogenase [NAD(P)+] n=1 Tax=Neptuniibacter caesariensis TaxID=207954 RepID=A0A7U8C525_NEPCE|nr:NAD(P)H-dependent glycerol-3-phosphate dehydrogenase [Neptuniibacter caesariensis]EAR61728.1 glycerol-3-phosphate dehydrogenase, biosynthetic [Neptuniibacter caesariensis]
MTVLKKVAVLGGGSFGTVIANLIAENGYDVQLWMRDQQRADQLNYEHENKRYLPGYSLSEKVVATSDLQSVVQDAELVFVSIPSQSFRDVIKQAKPFINEGQMFVSTTKGIEAKTFSLMSEILSEELPGAQVGVLSGPNLAKEVVAKQLTATVVASESQLLRSSVQTILHSSYFRVYASSDTYGVELGGTLKNIYAIAAGLSAALGMGENTRAMLMTRSLAEMSRFAVCMGANPMTFIGLAGVGDLIVTCMSPLSRNYRVGHALGEGKTLEEAVEALGQVAEGVNTIKQVKEKASEMQVYMPLVTGLYEVVFNHAPVAEVVKMLMMNEQSTDVEFVLPRGDI